MNIRRPIKLTTGLSLGLFAALAAGGLLMGRQYRKTDLPAPKPEQVRMVQNRVESAGSPQPAKTPALRQLAEPAPVDLQIMKPVVEETGYESPFSDTNKVPVKASFMDADPEKLRVALAAAVTAGSIRDIAALLHSGHPASEIEAVRMLAQIGGGDALAAALGKLLTVPEKSPDYHKFITAFADCHSPAVADWLTETLGQAKSGDLRQRMLDILAALRGPEVIDSLAARLASPLDAMHANDCAELLARASDPEQAAILRDLLETGTTPEIQTLERVVTR